MTKAGNSIRILIFSLTFMLFFAVQGDVSAQTATNLPNSQTSFNQGGSANATTGASSTSSTALPATNSARRTTSRAYQGMVINSPKRKNVTRKALKLRRMDGGYMTPFKSRTHNNIFKTKSFKRPAPYFSSSSLSKRSLFKK